MLCNAMQPMLCNQCYATNAMQPMLCNQCYATNAIQRTTQTDGTVYLERGGGGGGGGGGERKN